MSLTLNVNEFIISTFCMLALVCAFAKCEQILIFGLFLQAPAVGKLLMEHMTEGKFKTIDVQRFMFDRLLSNKRILEQNIV